jgi:hypothetical protein
MVWLASTSSRDSKTVVHVLKRHEWAEKARTKDSFFSLEILIINQVTDEPFPTHLAEEGDAGFSHRRVPTTDKAHVIPILNDMQFLAS